ncbi:hypothetical protein LguiA_000513 [Lonicera macranthoides]
MHLNDPWKTGKKHTSSSSSITMGIKYSIWETYKYIPFLRTNYLLIPSSKISGKFKHKTRKSVI